MPAGIRGRLISAAFTADELPRLPLFVPPPAFVRRRMEQCAEEITALLGPAASVRRVADVAIVPVLLLLDLVPAAREDAPTTSRIHTMCSERLGPVVLVTSYGDSLDPTWRGAVHGAIANDTRWCLCSNGRELRVVDARRTWSRAYLEFDLPATLADAEGQALMWSLLRGEAISRPVSALDEAVHLSTLHGANVCRALGQGVLHALSLLLGALHRPRQDPAARVFEHSLTLLYRLLFLLF